jgi:hypothetical protein
MTKPETGGRGAYKRVLWIVVICLVSLLATYAFSYFKWFKDNEYVALWLEGVALVFIFGLDYVNRLDDTQEQAKQHAETLAQLGLLKDQAEAAKTQATSSSDSLKLLKKQAQERELRELWRVLPILDDIRSQLNFWLNLFNENRWGAVNGPIRIMPADSSSVLIQAARHSNELWNKVRETFRAIANADSEMSRYYGQPNPAYRQQSLIEAAKVNLQTAEPNLEQIINAFAAFEQDERDRNE